MSKHVISGNMKPRRLASKIACACGCGTSIPAQDRRGRPRRFVHGHGNLGKSNWWLVKDRVKERTSHERAVKKKRSTTACEFSEIGGCLGILQVAHVDGDPFNNDPSNLKKLCQSHHTLLDNGRIDPEDPTMPEFYTDGSGKRRYQW